MYVMRQEAAWRVAAGEPLSGAASSAWAPAPSPDAPSSGPLALCSLADADDQPNEAGGMPAR